MRWPAVRHFAAALLVLAGWLLGACGALAGTIVLDDDLAQLDVEGRAAVWLDEGGRRTIAEVAAPAFAAQLKQPPPHAVYRLGDDGALWMHLHLQRSRDARLQWLLLVPMPLVDRVSVYQRVQGEWREETAGDTIAVARWPEPGRYPAFRLQLPPGEARDIFVRIHHVRGADFPVRLATASWHAQQVQIEYLGLGAAFGAMALLIVSCLVRSWLYRDPVFTWYCVYAALTTLAVASFTGVAAHLLWPGFGGLEDALTPMLASAAVGAALLFVRTALGLRRRFPLQERLMQAFGLAGVALALLPPLAPKAVHLPVVGGYITLACIVTLVISAIAWWRGDPVGRWVFAGQAPMVVSTIMAVARVLGWADIPFASQYTIVVALAIEVPLLLVALFIRSRDRHNAEIREQALSTHDALTGLLAPHLFQDRLRHVIAHHRRDGTDAAVMYIDLVNHARIREYFGNAVADQSLLRSVIKLRRLLRDVDTVSRVGEARFGVILEGASTRTSVTERATRLIAAGLMPLPGLKHDVTLQFHVAALLLGEAPPLEAQDIQALLEQQLARMSPRTRRPIRFVAQRQDSQPPSEGDSSLFAGAESELPPASGLATAP